MIKKALITGITSQDGAYLTQPLLEKGSEVFGLLARRGSDSLWRLRELNVDTAVQIIEGDLTEASTPPGAMVTGSVKAFGVTHAREHFKLHASSGILFNHESPLRSPKFVTRKVSMAAARIKLGKQKELRLGKKNLGWHPKTSLEELMQMMVEADLRRTGSE